MANEVDLKIEELPDRIAHRRRVAEQLNRAAAEYPADDPERTVQPGANYKSPVIRRGGSDAARRPGG